MAPRLRRMHPYHPRRKRAQGNDLNKQILKDLKHTLSADVGSLIVLVEEGNAQQIPVAQQKAKSNFLKHSAEMQKLAEHMGDRYSRAVRDYLDSIDVIVHSAGTWLDHDKIRQCFVMGEKLDKELAA